MKNFDQETFAIQYLDGDLVGIDKGSGGYPFVPDTLAQVHFFTKAQKQMWESYVKQFPNLKIVRVKITVEDPK